MTDTATDTTSTDDAGAIADPAETAGAADQSAEIEKWKALSRRHEERAKANAAAAKELEELRASAMSDQEKAVVAARAEGRLAALREAAVKVVDAEVRAAAAGRSIDIEALLEGLDRTRYIDDDGEVDRDGIVKWVDRVAPAQPTGSVLDLGQGARGLDQRALNGDPLLRDLIAKVGA